MYCGRCGTEVSNGVEFCPNCGNSFRKIKSTVQPSEGRNDFAYNQSLNDSTPNKSKLIKYAWFAPVSVILSFILIEVLNDIANELIYPDSGYSGNKYYITLAILTLLNIVLPFLLSIIFYSVATASLDYKIKKQINISVFVPVFFSLLPYVLSNVLLTIIGSVLGVSWNATEIICTVTQIALTVCGAVLSCIIVLKTLKSIDIKS